MKVQLSPPKSAAALDARINISIDCDEPDASIEALIAQVVSIDAWFPAFCDGQQVTVD